MNFSAKTRFRFIMLIFMFPAFDTSLATPAPKEQVFATERAFARTMAQRDFRAFANFVADEAIFFDDAAPLRGKFRVLRDWKQYFTAEQAPFSWEPDEVEVLKSGGLALSTGWVRDPKGKILLRFNSIWRHEANGGWKVIFDKGSPLSDAEKKRAATGVR